MNTDLQGVTRRRELTNLEELVDFLKERPYTSLRSDRDKYIVGMPIEMIRALLVAEPGFLSCLDEITAFSRASKILIHIKTEITNFKGMKFYIKSFRGFLKNPKAFHIVLQIIDVNKFAEFKQIVKALKFLQNLLKIKVMGVQFQDSPISLSCTTSKTKYSLSYGYRPEYYANDIFRKRERIECSIAFFRNLRYIRFTIHQYAAAAVMILKRLFSLWKGKGKQFHLRLVGEINPMETTLFSSVLLSAKIPVYLALYKTTFKKMHYVLFIRCRNLSWIRGRSFLQLTQEVWGKVSTVALIKAIATKELKSNYFFQTNNFRRGYNPALVDYLNDIKATQIENKPTYEKIFNHINRGFIETN